jgi:hypothetical protein
MGSKDPNDLTSSAKVILPNVERIMNAPNALNIICSGCKTPESEMQNFDPQKVIKKFKSLMESLPISVATFSPAIGGSECYVLLKKADQIEIFKAHEDPKYQHLIGQFKKPEIGMLVVIKDILKLEFNLGAEEEVLMIGDTWHDREAAHGAELSYLPAQHIHEMLAEMSLESFLAWNISMASC